MDTISMNSRNSKTYQSSRLLLNLTDKIKLKRSDKYVDYSKLSMYCTWKNIKKVIKSNKLEILAPIWSKKFELPDGP